MTCRPDVKKCRLTPLDAETALCSLQAVSGVDLLHAGPPVVSVLNECFFFFLRLVFRCGIRFTGCSHHPLSTDSQHHFCGGPDFLQPSQEQGENAKRQRSSNTWYALACRGSRSSRSSPGRKVEFGDTGLKKPLGREVKHLGDHTDESSDLNLTPLLYLMVLTSAPVCVCECDAEVLIYFRLAFNRPTGYMSDSSS